jgi:hypothetical protein
MLPFRLLSPWRVVLGLLMVLLACASHAQSVGEFDIRPVRPLTDVQLDRLRTFVTQNTQAAAYSQRLAEEAEPVLGSYPSPIEVIHYEGLVNTDPRRVETVKHLREMDDVALLLRYWQVAGDPRAQEALLAYLESWASTYVPTGNDVNENKFFPLFVAWAQFREDAETEAQAKIDAWMTDIAERHAKQVNNASSYTNRFNKSVRMLMVIGLALDRQEWRDLSMESAKHFIRGGLRADGTSYDLEHRDSLTYHKSALKPMVEIALLLPPEDGLNLYRWENQDGGSVEKSVEYMLPYVKGEKIHAEWVHTQVQIDRDRAAAGLEKYQPGRAYEPKNAADLFDLVAGLEPEFIPLARQLSDQPEAPYPSWNLFLASALEH